MARKLRGKDDCTTYSEILYFRRRCDSIETFVTTIKVTIAKTLIFLHFRSKWDSSLHPEKKIFQHLSRLKSRVKTCPNHHNVPDLRKHLTFQLKRMKKKSLMFTVDSLETFPLFILSTFPPSARRSAYRRCAAFP